MSEKKLLKNCPFCGGEAELVGDKYHWVLCKGCKGGSHAFETVEEAIKALEKQIPKKPDIQKMQIKDCIDQIQIFNKKICPSCGTVLCADWNFCFECGQALDWSEEE